jgi:hypothetical protein
MDDIVGFCCISKSGCKVDLNWYLFQPRVSWHFFGFVLFMDSLCCRTERRVLIVSHGFNSRVVMLRRKILRGSHTSGLLTVLLYTRGKHSLKRILLMSQTKPIEFHSAWILSRVDLVFMWRRRTQTAVKTGNPG